MSFDQISGPSQLRLFLGIAPNDHTRSALQQAFRQITFPVAYLPVSVENYHVTQYFFGSVPAGMLENLKALITLALRGFSAYELNFDQYCLAPPKQDPRMVWALYKPHPVFQAISQEIHELFLQIEPEAQARKKPLPHITLARMRPGPVPAWPALSPPPAVLQAKALTLWNSEQSATGSIYTPLAHFPLPPTPPVSG